jgi:hypothetical protein
VTSNLSVWSYMTVVWHMFKNTTLDLVHHLDLLWHDGWKAGIVEHADVATARKRHTKHMSMSMDMHAIIEELLEEVFSTWSVPMSSH